MSPQIDGCRGGVGGLDRCDVRDLDAVHVPSRWVAQRLRYIRPQVGFPRSDPMASSKRGKSIEMAKATIQVFPGAATRTRGLK